MDSKTLSEKYGVCEEDIGFCGESMRMTAIEGNVLVTTTTLSTVEVLDRGLSSDELVFNVQAKFLKKLLSRDLNLSDLTDSSKEMKAYVILDLPKELFAEEVLITTSCKDGLFFVCRDDMVVSPVNKLVPRIIDNTVEEE